MPLAYRLRGGDKGDNANEPDTSLDLHGRPLHSRCERFKKVQQIERYMGRGDGNINRHVK